MKNLLFLFLLSASLAQGQQQITYFEYDGYKYKITRDPFSGIEQITREFIGNGVVVGSWDTSDIGLSLLLKDSLTTGGNKNTFAGNAIGITALGDFWQPPNGDSTYLPNQNAMVGLYEHKEPTLITVELLLQYAEWCKVNPANKYYARLLEGVFVSGSNLSEEWNKHEWVEVSKQEYETLNKEGMEFKTKTIKRTPSLEGFCNWLKTKSK